MKYQKLLMAVCVIVIGASIMVFLFMKKSNSVAARPVSDNRYDNAIRELKSTMWDNYIPYIVEDDYKQLLPTASFADTASKVYTLGDVNEKRYKLVVRYSYVDCELCMNLIMKQIEEVGVENSLKDAIGITTAGSERDFLIKARETKWPIKVYSVADGTTGLSMENKNFPFMFVLTPEGRAVKMFMPSKEIPEQIKSYLTKVLKFVNEANKNLKN